MSKMILRNIYKSYSVGRVRSIWWTTGVPGRTRPCDNTNTPRLRCSHQCCHKTTVTPASQAFKTRNCLKIDKLPTSTPFCTITQDASLLNKAKSSCDSDDKIKGVDDEVILVVSEESSLEEGEFFDNPYHQDRKIQWKDVGKKVNVGESVICELNRLFQINRSEALRMVRPSKFLLVSDGAILKTLYFLKDHNISSQQVQRIPWIILQSVGLGFCHFTLKKIASYQKLFMLEAADYPDHLNRIHYLADKLKVPVEQLTERVIKPKHVLTMEMKRLEHMLNILHAYGVQSEDIVSDLWVFCHNVKIAEERLQQAREVGCERPKPWICHSTPEVFERYCERYRSQKMLLGQHKDVVSYLAHRLECEPHFVAINFQRNPGLKHIHVSKLKRKLDLLFSVGFTPYDVRFCLRVLQYSEKRTLGRIEELKEVGYWPFPISLLYKTPMTFKRAVDQYKYEKCMENEVDKET
ncbi:Transcription termination factor-like 2 [Homarus americanus]|uniref:Transcription termination factor-like 2 n=1 Tax=Homarus americanus TaxID=6706 RepID=A0A8J5MSD0_HOMAM|nr:Transcription termination factor-like 2 [Homarus americanus]